MNPTPCVLRPKIRAQDDGGAGMAPSPRLWAVVGLVGCARLAGGFFEVREGSKNDAKERKDKGTQGQQKSPVVLPTGLATIFVTLARLSLAGLHPCRAQLRFSGHPKYSWSLRCSVKIGTSAYRAGQFKIDTSAYRVGQFKIDISAYRVGDDRVRKNTLNNPCG